MSAFGWDYPAGAEKDPRAPWNEPEIPSAVSKCGTEYDGSSDEPMSGRFHQDWLEGLDGHEGVHYQMPRSCPACAPADFYDEDDRCGRCTDDCTTDELSGNAWCAECIADPSDPDRDYDISREGRIA